MNLGFQELVLIAAVALLVFGPERLPELARNAGKLIARFRAETSRSVEELKRAADLQDLEDELKGIRDDLRGVRSSVTGAFTGAAGAAAGSGSRLRADDAPPPMDPEAT